MKKIVVLAGDGIGVEVADQTIRVIDHLKTKNNLNIEYEK